eukprot:TRINITY_DN43393_c0_g1_i1.p1 TRINITY_DN43393_c0_g1~~TRINITY_DN43393_c0_g1_i1.p1  ORF type:complete len:258 (+),score=25.77 TRINITY_DN43393_c0_g1_i1:189-962(+)
MDFETISTREGGYNHGVAYFMKQVEAHLTRFKLDLDAVGFIDSVRQSLACRCRPYSTGELLQKLFARALNTGCHRHGGTPLHWAVWFGRQDAARLFIEQRANPNAKDKAKRTALAWCKAMPEMEDLLIDAGARAPQIVSLQVEAGIGTISVCASLLTGEAVRNDFEDTATVADVRSAIATELCVEESDIELVVQSTPRLLDGIDDESLATDAFYSSGGVEKRVDRDGVAYTRHEFLRYYGIEQGRKKWSDARPALND